MKQLIDAIIAAMMHADPARNKPDSRKRELRFAIPFLLSVNLLRAIVQLILYRQGFISVSADEFARGIRAAKWAADPGIDILADVQGTWLPLEKYLNGIVLLGWSDVIVAPRVTIFAASCLLVVVLFVLTYRLFDSIVAAALSVILISFQPWFVWLSGTPMLEMYYFTFFFAGLLFLLLWLSEARQRAWLWAGLCFLLASGFHVQSWIFINLVNLLTLPYFLRWWQEKKQVRAAKLMAFYFVGNGFIIGIAAVEYSLSGQIFGFLTTHTSYSQWFYGGYDVPALEKFLYYPTMLLRNVSGVFWILLIGGVAFLIKDREFNWKWLPLAVTVLALLFNSSANVLSGPPSAAPDRYSLFHTIILTPYVGYGAYRLLAWRKTSTRKSARLMLSAIATFLFGYALIWGMTRVPDFPRGMSIDAVEIGRELRVLLDRNPGLYMVELHYWEFLAVDLTSRHYDEIIFDRRQDIRDRDAPSIFLLEENDLCQRMTIPDLRYVVLNDEELKQRARNLSSLEPVRQAGSWTIFEIIPDTECNLSHDGTADRIRTSPRPSL